MKNRRITIVAFLLIAALTLGFGYAAVTNVLDIQGSASVSATAAEEEFNEDIYFTGVKDSNGLFVSSVPNGDGFTANINSNNNDKGQFTVTGLRNKDDSVEITYQIKNESQYEASVALKSITNTDDTNFGFTYYFGSNKDAQTATIASNGTVEVTVVVTLNQQLTAAASGSFTIELNVTAG